MTANDILFYLVILSCVLFVFRTARFSPSLLRGWIALSLLILAVAGTLRWTKPEVSGWVAFGLWAGLILVPSLLQRWVRGIAASGRTARAARAARWIRWLHPSDGWWEFPSFLEATDLAARGETDEATRRFARIEESAHPALRRPARLQRMVLAEEWTAIREWLGDHHAAGPAADPRLLLTWLRALGETGDLNGLLDAYARMHAGLERLAGGNVDVARMLVLAFWGRREGVERLLATRVDGLAEDTKTLWRITAEMAAGDVEGPRAHLRELLPRLRADSLRHAKRRLEVPLAVATEARDETSEQRLDEIEKESEHRDRYQPRARVAYGRAWVTYLLLAANVAVFVAEVVGGGSMDRETLVRLGALLTGSDALAEPWRAVAAGFLHYGPMHLVLNMIGLLYLGPFLELRLGRFSYSLVYLLSSVGALMFAASLRGPGGILVGASGGIMGLVGATGLVLFRGWRRESAQPARRRLRLLALLIVAQVIFDMSVPQVSQTAHMAGMVLGTILAAIVPHRPAD